MCPSLCRKNGAAGKRRAIDANDGNNLLLGGTGEDWLGYWGVSNAVTVNLSLTTGQNSGGGGTDTISCFENLAGSAFRAG